MKITEGAIIKSQWGYDQTNIDFYSVTKVNNGWAWLQPIGQTVTEEAGFLSEYVVPNPEVTSGKVFRRKIKSYTSGDYVAIETYAGGSVWSGKPCLQSHYA